jgi:hypothetical protein
MFEKLMYAITNMWKLMLVPDFWKEVFEVVPEFKEMAGLAQSAPHQFDVLTHTFLVVGYLHDADVTTRTAALWHDRGKPNRWGHEKMVKVGEHDEAGVMTPDFAPDENIITFYKHAEVGKDLARADLWRLGVNQQIIDDVCRLVDNHMWPSEIARAAIRGEPPSDKTLVKKLEEIGTENYVRLFHLARADVRALATVVTPEAAMTLKVMDDLEARTNKAYQEMLTKRAANPDLHIGGEVLSMELEIAPGPDLGAIIKLLKADVASGKLPNIPEALISQAKEYKEQLKLTASSR